MALLRRPTLCTLSWSLAILVAGALQGCGGGGDGGQGSYDSGGVYFDAPFVSAASIQGGSCTDLRQKQFIRSYLDEVYLWPELVQRRDATLYNDVHDYFDAIVAPASVDRFSFSTTTQAANNRENSVEFDVGIHWVDVGDSQASVWRIARVEPGSPAANAGLQRGDTLSGRVSTNLYSSTSGPYFYRFNYLRNGVPSEANLVPTSITEDPVGSLVTLPHNNRTVGYLAFESHYGNAQDQLIDAIHQARTAGVQDLVLDLRYNSGGFLYIAGSLASMIAPSSKVATQPQLVRLQPNSKQQDLYADAVVRMAPSVQYTTGTPQYRRGAAVPSLNLNRVYVLSSAETCSASESLINGLRGIDVDVHVIGDTTCGKPYGMAREDNCGAAFYPIEFRGVNAKGLADFSNGFQPTCRVADDLDHPRGDVNEALLAAALTHMATGACPVSQQGVARLAHTAQMTPAPVGDTYVLPQRPRPGLALINPR